MTEVAETYLGNVNSNSELALITSDCLKINLQFSDRHKGRIHTYTDSNLAVGIIKSRDRALQSGDLFKTNSGKFVLIHLQEPELLVIDLSTLDANVASAKLVHLGHVLGNHHYPIAIEDNQIYVQLITNKTGIEKLLENLNISGLQTSYQLPQGDRQITFSSHGH